MGREDRSAAKPQPQTGGPEPTTRDQLHAEDAEEHSAAKPQPNFWGEGTPRVLVGAEDAKPNRIHTTRRS